MIDTIKATLNTSRTTKILKVLEGQRTIINKQTGNKKIIGNIKNMSFHIFYKPNGLAYKIEFIGSINKYIHDNNFIACSHTEVKNAIESLSKLTGIQLHNATLKRIDIGASLIMKQPVSSYLLLLEEKKGRYKKTNIADETLYFFNRNRCFAFYDKTKECKKKNRELIPSEFKDKNVLRYELRYYKALAELFNKKNVILSDLYDIQFYSLLKKRWIKGYFEIIKRRVQNLNKVKNIKSLSDFLILNGVEQVGGYGKTMRMIDVFCKKRNIIPGGKYRLKKRIRELYSDKTNTKINKYNKELNRIIKSFKGTE